MSHEATLTGAPKVALEVLVALSALGAERRVVLRRSGALRHEFKRASDHLDVEPLRPLRMLASRLPPGFGGDGRLDERIAARVIRRAAPDLVYLNSTFSSSYVRPAKAAGIPVILHVHERRRVAERALRASRASASSEVSLLACSHAAANDLSALIGSSDVTVIESPVDVAYVTGLAEPRPQRSGQERRVVACGYVDWLKGTDLWLEVAAKTRQMMGDSCPRFLWVGGRPTRAHNAYIRTHGLDGIVDFKPALRNPYPEIATADVITITSRLESFPLVALEAMALGRPIVAFADAGLCEVLGDTNRTVPIGDTSAMAEAVVELLSEVETAAGIGASGLQRAALFDAPTFRQRVAHYVTERLDDRRRMAIQVDRIQD